MTLTVGTRVVVRYRIPDGRATDALGVLVSVDETAYVVQTKRGTEHIPIVDVIVARQVPPPPAPRPR